MGNDQRPTCICPTRYTAVDPSDPLSGYTPNFPQQICGQESQDSGLYTLTEMPGTDWAGGDYERLYPVEEERCRQACLVDCFCAVAIYDRYDKDCWKKLYPFSNGVIDSSTIWKGLVKVSNASANSNSPACGNNDSNKFNKNRSALVITGSVLFGSSFLLLLLLSLFLLCFGLKIRKSKIDQAKGFSSWTQFKELHLKRSRRSYGWIYIKIRKWCLFDRL